MSKIIKTKYGNARLNEEGYWQICSKNEGNQCKLLHRLIYEDHYGVKLPSNKIVHHKDGNKTNNDIRNLEIMGWGEHTTHHLTGNELSKKIKKKISKSRRKHSKYYRVAKIKSVSTTQGFLWKYRFYDKTGKCVCVTSVTLKGLKEKVIAKGWEWREL